MRGKPRIYSMPNITCYGSWQARKGGGPAG